jgi:hypothetical protein
LKALVLWKELYATMKKLMQPGVLLVVLLSLGCQPKPAPESAATWQKVRLNFRQLDSDGLKGPSGGKVAVNYEFCIPRQEKYWRTVQKIDTSAQQFTTSRGRIGCSNEQWLIVGSTHQPKYRRVLYDLASLPYVELIQEVYWE